MADIEEEEKKEEVEPVQEEVKEEPVQEEVKEEKAESDSDKLISIQAARYMQICNLESQIFDDGLITNEEMGRVSFCKSQVLVELVSVADYVSKLPANHPQKQAGNALLKHLYKCYEKTENMQDRARKQVFETRYKKDVEHEMNNIDARMQRAYGDVVTDDWLLPNPNVINLKNLSLSTGTMAMLSQLIKNPSKSIESQMPTLIEELNERLSSSDKLNATTVIGSLLTGLARMKSEKTMMDALEGKNLANNILSMISGNSL